MAFVKLDTNILDSTLWIDLYLREVFITALLMAEPREFREDQKQIEVDSLKNTDFVVPPGWYGFVKAAGIGIVNRAGVPREHGMEALRRLGSPESESRSHEFEGRRMVRVNGGYLILNYMKYRDRDHTAAERMRRLRARKKNEDVPRNVTLVPRNDTEAECRVQSTDTKKEKIQELLLPAVIKLPATKGDFYPVTQVQIDHWKELFPAIDVLQELRAMVGWLESNSKNKKTLTGMPRFISGWLTRAQNKAPRQPIIDSPKPKKVYVAGDPNNPADWAAAQLPLDEGF